MISPSDRAAKQTHAKDPDFSSDSGSTPRILPSCAKTALSPRHYLWIFMVLQR